MAGPIRPSDKWRGHFERRSIQPRFGVGRAGRALSYEAFVPDPVLEIELSMSGNSVGAVSAAETALHELNSSPPRLAILEGLATQLLRTEALASSAIEGLQLSHKRLAQAAVFPAFDQKAREVLNNARAMERAIDLARRPAKIALSDLQAVHATLAEGTRLAPWAGKLRDEPGWIGGATPADASYVPPPEEHLEGLLSDLVAFVNERDDLPPVLQAAIAHAQFETIHPFPDGNGRVGRCLIHAMLIRRGAAPRYVPPISLVLAARRKQYIGGLTTFRRGNVAVWSDFFAETTRAAAGKATSFAHEVEALQDRWRGQTRARSDAAAWTLIDRLPAQPVLDVEAAKALTGRTFQSASDALATLERAGVLRRRDNRKRGRSWEAPELLDLVKELEAELVG